MTAVTMTQYETLFCMPAAGTALANSSAAAVISGNSATVPAYQLPALASLWEPSYMVGRSLKFIARGTFGTTGTPTLTMVLRLDPTQNSTTNALTLAATGALTAPSSVTNGNWELECDVTISALGVSSGAYSATLNVDGIFTLGAGNNAATSAAVAYMIGAQAISMSGASVNPGLSAWPELWATWGTANASNTIQATQFMCYGMN